MIPGTPIDGSSGQITNLWHINQIGWKMIFYILRDSLFKIGLSFEYVATREIEKSEEVRFRAISMT
jgi:hypothetical protein